MLVTITRENVIVLQTVQWAIGEARDVDGQDKKVLGGSRQVRSQRLPLRWNQRSQACLQTCGRNSFKQ